MPLSLLPWPRAASLNALLSLADIHLLPAGLVAHDPLFPAKVAALLASGRPVLAAGEVPPALGEAVLHSAADADGGTPKTLFRETTKAWVEPDYNQKITFLKDGSFLWLSERSGFKHLYQYAADGSLKKQITNGQWEVRSLHGIDNNNDWIYFSGTERSVLGSDVYRVHVDGSGLTRLSETAGAHRANFNPSMTQFVDSWSDVQTPPQISLMRNDGSRVRVIDANEAAALRDYRVAKPEFLQVKTRDGFTMEAMMIKPPDFDPSRKYPVYEYTYSGPHAQSVVNGWRGALYLWWQLLAQRGVIVWVCDNRSASGKGMEATWPIYKHFGELELPRSGAANVKRRLRPEIADISNLDETSKVRGRDDPRRDRRIWRDRGRVPHHPAGAGWRGRPARHASRAARRRDDSRRRPVRERPWNVDAGKRLQ